MNILANKTNEQVYLEWLNDFISIERMAEFYNGEQYEIELMICEGRKEHYKNLDEGLRKRFGYLTTNN